jgi:hypothetical protein
VCGLPGLVVILLHHGVLGGGRQQIRYVKSKLQKTASFIVVESLDVPPERTLTPSLLPWHSRKIRVDSSFFFKSHFAKIQNQASVTRLQGRSSLAKMLRSTNVSYSDGWPEARVSHDPLTIPPCATYMQQRLLNEGPKAGICRVNRMDVDLMMQTFIKNSYEF